MKQGQPTPEQLYEVIGSIYADAYLRINSLEEENKSLRQDRQSAVASIKASMDSLREENARLKEELALRSKECNNGNVNSMLPVSLQDKSPSASTD